MHSYRVAIRTAEAEDRIEASMASLVEMHGVGSDELEAYRTARTLRKRRENDAHLRRLFLNEAAAGFATLLADHLGTDETTDDLMERLTAIPGVGPAIANEVITVLNTPAAA